MSMSAGMTAPAEGVTYVTSAPVTYVTADGQPLTSVPGSAPVVYSVPYTGEPVMGSEMMYAAPAAPERYNVSPEVFAKLKAGEAVSEEEIMGSAPEPLTETPILGNFKSAPKDAGLMPDGSGRMTVSFVAKQGKAPKTQAAREAALQTEIRTFMKLQKQAREPGYNHIIEFVPERSCLGPPACLTLELVKPFGCDLLERLHETTPSTKIRAVSQVCEALGFLQSCGVVHGDLKCENVLLTSTNDIKLIDFGMAANVGETKWWPAGDNIPKRMRAKTMPAEFSQDLYGVGFIIQQFIWGSKAFKNEVPQAKATKEGLLANRMTLQELVQEPWIQRIRRSSSCSTCSTCSSLASATPHAGIAYWQGKGDREGVRLGSHSWRATAREATPPSQGIQWRPSRGSFSAGNHK